MAESSAVMLIVIQQLGSTRTLAVRISCSRRRPIVPTLEERNGTTRLRGSCCCCCWGRAPCDEEVGTHSLSTLDTTTNAYGSNTGNSRKHTVCKRGGS